MIEYLILIGFSDLPALLLLIKLFKISRTARIGWKEYLAGTLGLLLLLLPIMMPVSADIFSLVGGLATVDKLGPGLASCPPFYIFILQFPVGIFIALLLKTHLALRTPYGVAFAFLVATQIFCSFFLMILTWFTYVYTH